MCVVRQGTPGKRDGPVLDAIVIPVDAIEEITNVSAYPLFTSAPASISAFTTAPLCSGVAPLLFDLLIN